MVCEEKFRKVFNVSISMNYQIHFYRILLKMKKRDEKVSELIVEIKRDATFKLCFASRGIHGRVYRKQVIFLKILHRVIRKIRNYYLLRRSLIQERWHRVHIEQPRIYSYCFDNIKPPCHMFSHKMRLKHVLQRECLVAWLYDITYAQRCIE